MRTAQNLLLTLLSVLPGCQSQLAGFKEMGESTGTARPQASATGGSSPSATASASETGTASGSEIDASAAPSQSATTVSSDAGVPIDSSDVGVAMPDTEAGMELDAGDAAAVPDSGVSSTSQSASATAAGSAEPSASVASSVSAIPSASPTASAMPPSMCPADATYVVSDDACYRIAPTRQTRADASATCTSFGAGWHLAEVFSAQQNANIRSLNAAGELWLGASRASGGTRWSWQFSGIDFFEGKDTTGAPIGGSYVNWNSVDQPTGGAAELCARMLVDGTWGDIDCLGAAELPYGACQGPTL